MDVVLKKMTNVLGEERARTLFEEVLAQLGVLRLETPDDRYRFADALMRRGGLLEAIGRAIKIQAILHGARETA